MESHGKYINGIKTIIYYGIITYSVDSLLQPMVSSRKIKISQCYGVGPTLIILIDM